MRIFRSPRKARRPGGRVDVPRDSIVTEAIASWIEREERLRDFHASSLASNSIIVVGIIVIIDWAEQPLR